MKAAGFAPPLREGVSASLVALPPGPWATVFAYLCEKFPHVSPVQWAERFAQSDIWSLAGKPLALDQAYLPDSRIYYFRAMAQETPIPFEHTVIYQDEHLVIADKPHFLPVVPSGQFVRETLLVRLRHRLNLPELTPIHRIDRETAGLVAFSCRRNERSAYHRLFAQRLVEKHYEALAPVNEELSFPLQRSSRIAASARFMQMEETVGTPNALTHINLRQRLAGGIGLFDLRPTSGVTHQLRVHMSALSMPMLGDRIYPHLQPFRTTAQEDFSTPLQLLARSQRFTDPISGIKHLFVSQRRLVGSDYRTVE